MPNTQERFRSFTPTRDRRQYSRKTTSSLTYVKLGDNNGGIVLNICEGGLAITAADVLIGEYLPRMRFQLPKCSHRIETRGRIVWLTESKKGAGIQFVDLAQEDRNQIRQWISSRGTSSEIQNTATTGGKSGEQIKILSPSSPRKVVPEIKIGDEIDETQFEELFPSESAPRVRLEAKGPTAVHVQPPITQTNGQLGDSLPDTSWPFWSDRVEPAPVHRSKLRLVALGALLTATSFAIGVTLGYGSFESVLRSIERLTSEWSQPAPSVAPPPAASVAGRSSPSAVGPPEQGADISTQPPRNPASPIPSVFADGNDRTQVAGTPSDPPRIKRSAENKTKDLDQPGELILVTPPGEGEQSFRLTVPEKAISASASFAISSQSSILVPPEAGPASFHQPERLQLGDLIFYVVPQYPQGRDQIESEEIVKLRATVGKDGQITDVKRISGSMSLIPAAMSAIREWRYTPTLLNGRPVQTEEDVTIEFRAR